MNIVVALIIIGFLPVVVLAFATFHAMYKNANAKSIFSVPVPVSGGSPREISKRMVKAVRMGQFRMHILTNEAPQFNDGAYLAGYISYIKTPSALTYIQQVKGEHEYE